MSTLAQLPEYTRLRVLRILSDDIDQRINNRAALTARLLACKDTDGQVTVIESGRDCDGVQYSGHKHRIAPTLVAYTALESRIGESADGPFYLRPVPPAVAADTKYESRDLVMEAYENGHPHRITSAYA